MRVAIDWIKSPADNTLQSRSWATEGIVLAIFVIAWLLLGCLLSTPGHTEELSFRELASISHRIAYINSFGRWQAQGKTGYFRFIVVETTTEPRHSKAYLQWIQEADDQPAGGGQGAISRLKPVTEINASGVFSISGTRASATDDAGTIDFTAVNQFNRSSHHVRIVPGAPGTYVLRFLEAPSAPDVDRAVEGIPLGIDDYVRPTY